MFIIGVITNYTKRDCSVFRIECFHRYVMDRRQLTSTKRWQTVGMSQACFNNRRMAGQMGYTIMQWSSYAVFESHENGWWKPTIWQVPQTYYLEDRVIARCTRNISFCYISSYSNCILGIVYPEELLTDGPMSSACAKRRSIKWSQLPLDHGWTRWNWSRYQSPSEHS